jgi:hypothetical protein
MHERLREELQKFGIVSAYLFICFLILELYRSSVLSEQNVHSLTLGIAFFKALILGKFILIGDAAKVGTRVSARTIWHRIAWKALMYWLTLILLTLIEEIIVGWVHKHGAAESVIHFFDRPAIQYVAPSLVMLMILIPLIAFAELNRALGAGVLRSVLMAEDSRKPEGRA